MNSLIKGIKKEMKDELKLVEVPYLVERLSASVCCHCLNLYNLRTNKYHSAGIPEDFRQHVIFMGPSGFGKSLFYELYLNTTFGFIKNLKLPTDVQTTYSPESWMGSVTKVNKDTGAVSTSKGVFERYKEGIIAADEYAKIAIMMEADRGENEEAYLLTALSKRKVVKNLAHTSIEVDNIGTTFWCGLRPSKVNMKSGLARRFSLQLFLPTMSEAEQFSDADTEGSLCIGEPFYEDVYQFMEDMYAKAAYVDKIDTSDIKKRYKFVSEKEFLERGLKPTSHFDRNILRRLAIGYALANGDEFPKIKLTEDMQKFLDNEMLNRSIVKDSPEHEAVLTLIRERGVLDYDYLISFMKEYYQFNEYHIRSLIMDMIYQKRIELKDKKLFYLIKP